MTTITKEMMKQIEDNDLRTLKGRKACLENLKALGLPHLEAVQLINENL